MWSTVELREIRLFLTLAEELHFGRTAERLRITPSRVSQILNDLETKLGQPLVHRTSRRVELTVQGEKFRSEVGAVHGKLLEALQRAYDDGDELAGTLRLGLLSPTVEGPQMPAITTEFERQHPGCDVVIERAPYGDAFGALRRGEFDLLASWLPHGQDDMLEGPTLTREPLFLGVAEDHPLAERDQVSVEDFGEYYMLPMEQLLPVSVVNAWFPRTTPSGRPIRRLRAQLAELAREDLAAFRFQLAWRIKSGEIIHPAMAGAGAMLGPGIKWVPISDIDPLSSALVWPRGTRDLRRDEFVRVAAEMLSAEAGAVSEHGARNGNRRKPARSRPRAAGPSPRKRLPNR